MGRTAAKALSAKQVETETRPGYHADGPHTGLYLQVTVVNERVMHVLNLQADREKLLQLKAVKLE